MLSTKLITRIIHNTCQLLVAFKGISQSNENCITRIKNGNRQGLNGFQSQPNVHTQRLNDIFESTELFGGKNVLFVGDILQLPPVNGSPVFAEVTQAAVKYRIGSMGAINIWQDTVLYNELTINEKQKTDQTFSDMLDCVRRGIKSNETISTLSQWVILKCP